MRAKGAAFRVVGGVRVVGTDAGGVLALLQAGEMRQVDEFIKACRLLTRLVCRRRQRLGLRCWLPLHRDPHRFGSIGENPTNGLPSQ